MLIRTLYFEQASIIAAVACSLIVAGLLKGIIGVGMPVVALPLLLLFIDIKSAAMLLSMPLIFSNLPQALEGGKTGRCLMQLLAKGLRGKAFTKEASLYLVVSAGLLAILLTASRQFSWLDVSVSTAAMLPIVLGMYVGQHMRDKIAPETFEKLVLIAVIAAGAELLRHGFFS